jgi:PAS domain S-box-containing protein
MIGRNVEALIPEDRREFEREMLATIARGERMESYQSERVRKDGATLPW